MTVNKKNIHTTTSDQTYFGNGKLLLSGEYFVLDGAMALALPTVLGQTLSVKYSPSYSPLLRWKSFDVNGNCFLEAEYEFWHFDLVNDENPSKEKLFIQKILREARKQNSHFLRDDVNVSVEARLEFPITWGLGSSSTLIYNIAQWAYVSPFELLFNTSRGSGYDIACAQSGGPIVYQKKQTGPYWSPVKFHPNFHKNLYFLYLGQKQCSEKAIEFYKDLRPFDSKIFQRISRITQSMLDAKDLDVFEYHLNEHEQMVSLTLDLPPVKMLYFNDFWGEVKSLGAWGGDFVMVTSKESKEVTRDYFAQKGFDIFFSFRDLILAPKENIIVSDKLNIHTHDFQY